MLPGKRRTRCAYAEFSRAHAGEDWTCLLLEVRVLHRKGLLDGVAASRKAAAVLKKKKLKAGKNPEDGGWQSEPIWQAACRHVAPAWR